MGRVVFVTGTDTGVGKTAVSGGLLRALSGRRASYWKPIQTGTVLGDDTQELERALGLGPEYFVPPAHRFPDPVSPHLAAKPWGKTLDAEALGAQGRALGEEREFLIVEGAGGVLVPLNDESSMAGLMVELGAEVLLVVEDRLGAINHALLSIEALRRRQIPVAGFVMSKATGRWGNAPTIAAASQLPLLAEVAEHSDYRTLLGQYAAQPKLRQWLGLEGLPL